MNISLPRIPAAGLRLACALLFALVYNLPVYRDLREIAAGEHLGTGFGISVPLFFTAFFVFVFSLPVSLRATRILVATLALISSLLSYATLEYKIIFNGEMFRNVFETNAGEAASYFSLSFALWLIFTGIIPVALVLRWPVKETGRLEKIKSAAMTAALSILLIGGIAGIYFEDYAANIRNHKILRKTHVPFYALGNLVDYAHENYFTAAYTYTELGQDAHEKPAVDGKPRLTVLIVGETQRAANYGLNGYHRNTNPYTSKLGITYFKNVTSCGTATAVSVPCMFSLMTRKGYERNTASHQDNVIDIVHRAGTDVTWIDNDAGCKGVCERISMTDIRAVHKDDPRCDMEGCLDEMMAEELAARVKNLPKDKDQLIILHIMGSHGPTYFKRYTQPFHVFMPDCDRSDIQNCPHEALINTYDNTIVYSDYVMSEVIKTLTQLTDSHDTGMIFISDHGESLGEKGIYLHGLPYSIAPDEQTHVPMIMWLPPQTRQSLGIKAGCLEKIAETGSFSHDNLPHTLMGLTGVETTAYNRELDILSACR